MRDGVELCLADVDIETAIGEALGMNEWSPDVFREKVKSITASGANTLELRMIDGTIRQIEWSDRSRAESWTPEMKEKMSENVRRRYNAQNSNRYPTDPEPVHNSVDSN